MNVSQTKKGRACKLCKNSTSGKCHIHKKVARMTSKKASLKSPKSLGRTFITGKKDTDIIVLKKLPNAELKRVCYLNKTLLRICQGNDELSHRLNIINATERLENALVGYNARFRHNNDRILINIDYGESPNSDLPYDYRESDLLVENIIREVLQGIPHEIEYFEDEDNPSLAIDVYIPF